MAVSKAEFLWREWVLGEGRYAGKGARSSPRPPSLPARIPKGENGGRNWWAEIEEFLARRDDHQEPGVKPKPQTPQPKPLAVGQLTEHFHVREFACHDGRHVPKIAVPALVELCVRFLEPMRAEFGQATVMSGYRPADYNRRIGGAQFSQHIYELTPSSVAADLIFARGRPADWYRFADQLGAGGVGRYPSFVHVDNRPERARWTG